MKKSSRKPGREEGRPVLAGAPRPAQRKFVWWPWVGALAALFLIFEAYGPALNGAFVLDDRYLPFFNPAFQSVPLSGWINGLRPLLYFSFWMNYAANGVDPYLYHVTNVVFHFFNSVLVALIAARLLEWAGVDRRSIAHPSLGVFAGALFLLHPIQTESVAYVASRSEVLSVFFYYAAYCVFLYRKTAEITWLRSLAVVILFGAAASTKEHTLTLPLLLVLTDLFWFKRGIRDNRRLYRILAIAAVIGGIGVARVLSSADTAGFRVPGLTPVNYFFTQCRVLWMYVRLVVLPVGQNLDPDVAITHTAFDPVAWLGLLAAAALIVGAWIYRRRWPLAAFGVFVFFLLLAPTSSIVPIADPMAERRVYLPFLGLSLIAIEFLRRIELRQRLMIEVPVLLALFILTYQRSTVWATPMALWSDAVQKSPQKLRPRSQLAFAYYEEQNCAKAAENYEIASRLATPDYPLLINWAYSLDCSGHPDEAIQKLREATQRESDPQAWALLGMVYGKQHKTGEALASLDQAQKLNPNYVMTFAVRGNVYESIGDMPNAIQQYQRAAALDPNNEPVRQSLARALGKNH